MASEGYDNGSWFWLGGTAVRLHGRQARNGGQVLIRGPRVFAAGWLRDAW